MKTFFITLLLALMGVSAFCQKDSLALKLFTSKVDKDNLDYSVRLEFISNKKNEIFFQLEPRYVMPNDIDGIGLRFEHLEGDCYASKDYSDAHPLFGLDIFKDNIKKMSSGDTATITLEIGSYIKTIIGRIKGTPSYTFTGQHRVRAYRTYWDECGYSTKFSNWLYINFDERR